MYTPLVLEHFKNPRNAGELPDATAWVEVTNPVCGDILKLAARIEDDRVTSVRFQAQGCVTAVACASVLTEQMQGRNVDELSALTAEGIAAALGGLPPATAHGGQLAVDALRALLAKLKYRP